MKLIFLQFCKRHFQDIIYIDISVENIRDTKILTQCTRTIWRPLPPAEDRTSFPDRNDFPIFRNNPDLSPFVTRR